MLKDVIVIDDVFDNPDELVFKSREFDFYDLHNHPVYSEALKKEDVYYPGFRTESLELIDKNLYNSLMRTILLKCLDDSVGLYRSISSFNCIGRMHFHYINSDSVVNDKWKHRDPTLMAGVVYLKKNPPPNTGTVLYIDGKETVVENRYNRLVLYRSDILHKVQESFGKNIYDSRLTLTIFIDKITLDVYYDKDNILSNDA